MSNRPSSVCRLNYNRTCHNDEHIISDKKSTCICPEGFNGERCEMSATKIIVLSQKYRFIINQCLYALLKYYSVMLNMRTLPLSKQFQSIKIQWRFIIGHVDFILNFWTKSINWLLLKRYYRPATIMRLNNIRSLWTHKQNFRWKHC
jgi:hypothetical protein